MKLRCLQVQWGCYLRPVWERGEPHMASLVSMSRFMVLRQISRDRGRPIRLRKFSRLHCCYVTHSVSNGRLLRLKLRLNGLLRLDIGQEICKQKGVRWWEHRKWESLLLGLYVEVFGRG